LILGLVGETMTKIFWGNFGGNRNINNQQLYIYSICYRCYMIVLSSTNKIQRVSVIR